MAPNRKARRWLHWPTILAGSIAFAALGLVDGRAADATRTTRIDGLERRYVLHVPTSVDGVKPVPLVIVLHGGGGNADAVARQTRFNIEAGRHGFVVAYPDGTGRARPVMQLLGNKGVYTWNAGGCCGDAMDSRPDDVAFIRAMVEKISREIPIDRRRIYAAGISNGAMMAYRLACEASDIFAAVGAVAGPMVAPSCRPGAPVAVIHIHGSADEYVPEQGGAGRKFRKLTYPPVQDTITFWSAVDGCERTPRQTEPVPGVRLFEYRGCGAGTAVTYYSINGGGHAWPGGDRMAFFLDAPSKAIAATPLIWQFFERHPKAQ